MLRKAALIGLLGFVLAAPPVSAGSIDNGTKVFYSIGGSAVMGIVCAAVAALTWDEDDSEDESYTRKGWIFGFGGTYGIESFDDAGQSVNRDSLEPPSVEYSTDDSFGIKGGGGYRCHEYMSTEVGFEYFFGDGFDGEFKQNGFGEFADVDVNPLVITIDNRVYAPFGRFQPFGLLGTGVMLAETKIQDDDRVDPIEVDDDDEPIKRPLSGQKDASFTMRFGGGIDIYATQNVMVRAEGSYVRPFGNLDDLKYGSVGVGIHFRF